MKMGFRRQFLVLAGAGMLLVPAAGNRALAETPAEAAMRDLVSAIDASPGWTAAFRHLSYDAPTDTAVLSGLSIATPAGEVKIDFESVSVTGYAAAPGGGFTAKSIKTDGVAVDFGPVKTAMGDISFDDVGVPAVPGGLFDPEKPFTSIVALYSNVLKARLGHGHIKNLSVIEVIEGITTRISYQDFELSGLQDGKTASISAGPLKMQSPSPDGLVNLTVAKVEATDMDLAAMMHVYDPSEYGSDGAGDMIWRTVLGHAAYKGVEMELPGAKITLGDFSLDAFKARQPKHHFAVFLDKIVAHPDQAQRAMDDNEVREGLVDMMSAFAIGRFGMSGMKVQASGITQFELGEYSLSDLSIEGLGEMAITGLAGSVEGQGSLKVGRFALGGLKFADPELWRAAILAAPKSGDEGGDSGGSAELPLDPTQLMPKLGFVEASGIDIQSVDIPHFALGKFRVDLSDYVGYIPTKADASLSGLELPVAAMDPATRETFARLGYDHLSVDYGLKYAWDEAKQELTVDDFHVRAADVGGIVASAVIGGVARSLFEHPDPSTDLAKLALVSGKLTFNDESIVGKGLGLAAEKLKFPPDKFRQQFADAMPFLLSISALNNPALMTMLRQSGLMQKLTPAVKTFVAQPFGSLTLVMTPAAPVDLTALSEAAEKAPETLIGLLNLSISAEPGRDPSEPAQKAPDQDGAPKPELRQTITPK